MFLICIKQQNVLSQPWHSVKEIFPYSCLWNNLFKTRIVQGYEYRSFCCLFQLVRLSLILGEPLLSLTTCELHYSQQFPKNSCELLMQDFGLPCWRTWMQSGSLLFSDRSLPDFSCFFFSYSEDSFCYKSPQDTVIIFTTWKLQKYKEDIDKTGSIRKIMMCVMSTHEQCERNFQIILSSIGR